MDDPVTSVGTWGSEGEALDAMAEFGKVVKGLVTGKDAPSAGWHRASGWCWNGR